jgi:quercetin dioxygenase-like cupin family protein
VPLVQAGNRTVQTQEGSLAVTIGRITLEPGAAIARHQIQNVELVVVEEGNLTVTVEHGAARVRNTEGHAATVDDKVTLELGNSASFEPGAIASYRAAGEETTVLLVVRLTVLDPTTENFEAPLTTHHVGHPFTTQTQDWP